MKREFLLEIGSEEIPAAMLLAAAQSLRELLSTELKNAGLLTKSGIEVYWTPRRLVAHSPDIPQREPDRVEELLGPPHRVAFDVAGKPTQAAESFAAKHGVAVEALKVSETPKGKYVTLRKRIRGRSTVQVLADILPRVIAGIRFPRTMYWTSRSGPRFIRPIRWLLALYGGRVVDFELAGVKAGRSTWGHRFLEDKRLPVREFRDYRAKLRRARVLVVPEERAQRIRAGQRRLLARESLRPGEEPGKEAAAAPGALSFEDLLQYAVNSTEYPTAILGKFQTIFARSLPEEILVTVMVHHQKYFHLRDRRGHLAPKFLAVIDREADRGGLIRRGHERVLEARFRDAEFFWHAERRIPLESRLPLLGGILFAQGLGSYRDKTGRIEQLAAWLAANARANGRRADAAVVRRAAQLSKCDLTTQLVGEFPELQGIVGGLYAREQGEDERVAAAIYQHYQPRRAGDRSPASLEGALVAIADKIDSVVSCLAVGLEPSGSSDPFGLRRAAQGAVKVILDHSLRVPLESLIEEAVKTLVDQAIAPPDEEQVKTVHRFLLERLPNVLVDFTYDELNAVLAAGSSDLVDVRERLKALHRVRPSPHFEPLSVAFKRIRNILEQAGDQQGRSHRPVDPTRLEPGPERELFNTFQQLRPQVADLCRQQNYIQALRLIATLRPYVDRFFDRVLVMTDDLAVRENRLTLLAHLLSDFSSIANFAELVPTSYPPPTQPDKEGDHG